MIRSISIALPVLLAAILAMADTITMKSGTTHEGTLVSSTSTTVTFRENGVLHHYKRSSIQSIDLSSGTSSNGDYNGYGNEPSLSQRSNHAPAGSARAATIPAGTEIAVMTNQNIESANANPGQVYSADIANNITDTNGNVVVPKGSPAELVLRDVNGGGVGGTRDMAVDLQSIKVGDRRYMVESNTVEEKGREGLGANKRTAEYVGGGTVLGTLIGAAAGGGKGAAIGAVSGAAAGAGTQVLTRGKAVRIPAETTMRFRLEQPLRLNAAY